jgi:hypothetical protein
LHRRDAKAALHLGLEGAATAKSGLCAYGLYRPVRLFTQQAAGIKKAFLIEIIA